MTNPNISIGNYSVVKELASGSFGHVYLAQHKLLTNRIVAIKLLRATHLDSPEERESFLQEANLLAGLKHPYILPFIDFGIHEGFPYLVAEYAPNGTLKERLYRHSPNLLPVVESLTILSQIGEALDYAHRQNIVHRDLKPGNILFNAKEEALVADFGLATTLDMASIKQVNNEGTPRYMAPEQFQGIVSKESDQYALGVIAYELFTGHSPFVASDFFTMGYKKITENPTPPTRYNPSLPAHFEQAILKAIAKNRTDRHTNVQALIAALRTPGIWQAEVPTNSETNMPTVASVPGFLNQPSIAPLMQTYTPTVPSLPSEQPLTQTNTSSPTLPVGGFPGSIPASQLEMEQMFPLTPIDPMDRSSSGGRSQASQETVLDDDTDKGSKRYQQIFANNDHAPTLIMHPDQATRPFVPQLSGNVPLRPTDSILSTLPASGHANLRQEADVPTYIAGIVVAPPMTPQPPLQAGDRRRRWLLFAAALVLLLLLVSGGVLYALNNFGKSSAPVSQANGSTNSGGSNTSNTSGTSNAPNTSTANVTITPASKDLKLTYTIFEVTGTPDASQNQVAGARLLPSSTQSGSQTANATGQGSTAGTRATGTLEFDNPNSYSFNLPAGTGFTDPNGLVVYTSAGVTVPANGSTSVSAYAGRVGTSGNIPAYDFDANYYVPGHGTDVFRVVNTQSFSGGQNPQTYTFVRQSDIDGAANSLETTLTTSTQQAAQAGIASNEQLIGAIQCSHNVSANHNAGDRASSVTVTVSVTCAGEVYNPQMAQPLAVNLFKHDLTSQLGANYIVAGDVLTTVSQPNLLTNGTVSVQVQAEGVGVFQFSNAQQQQLAQLIASKSKNDAQALLLKQAGVHDASIDLSGSGDATLPTDPRNIKIVVAKVSGLKTTS